MADDKSTDTNSQQRSKLNQKVSKKSTSKRRILNISKNLPKSVDNQKNESSPSDIVSIQERTVIGQEALPKNIHSNIEEPVKELFKSTVEFSEHIRSEAEGSEDGNAPDVEIEELSKLRCTSERTEVIAEREKRKRQRCADYPGLAFGSSIFSSDTLMKFSVIRNELHNILNSQLKRVSISLKRYVKLI